MSPTNWSGQPFVLASPASILIEDRWMTAEEIAAAFGAEDIETLLSDATPGTAAWTILKGAAEMTPVACCCDHPRYEETL